MKKQINYITIDGRGEHETFKDCITKVLQDLKSQEGIHVIKDFEPFPMYKMMEEKGFDKYVKKISDEEFHVYFTPKDEVGKIQMEENLKIDRKKIDKIMAIKLNYLKGNISLQAAKKEMQTYFKSVTAQEFAICEQYLQQYGISDDVLAERMDEILEIFDGVLVSNKLDVPLGHPIRTYLDEVEAIRIVLNQIRNMIEKKFIKNQWAEIYDKLEEINIHFARKQNQLYPSLESKGFDKPSKVMWTLENNIKDIIKKARGYLDNNEDGKFLNIQNQVVDMVEDMMVKEEEIIKAFRKGEQDEAEFWLEIGGKFIYIIYNAVRDEDGNFRGVLEMMQDVTKIRGLEGSQRLLSWSNKKQDTKDIEINNIEMENQYEITKETIIGDLVKEYSFIKEFLFNLSPRFSKLKNPILFKTMSSIATIEMISERGGLKVEDTINKIVEEINTNR